MTITKTTRHIVLQFDPALDLLPSGKRLSEGMSAAAAVANALWLTHDETVSVERLVAERTRQGSFRYAGHRRFDLREFIALPAFADDAEPASIPETDSEGIAFCDDYLWIAGSHSAARDEAEGTTAKDSIAALANVRRAGNRFLLARIPMVASGADSAPILVRECRTADGRMLRAGRLSGGRKNNALTRALRKDPHLGPFLPIPSKDNGFDIEGLAAAPGGRLFLGLRGPVLDGWACLLEIQLAEHPTRKGELVLRELSRETPSSKTRARYRKHFLDLSGSGIRDICVSERDLLILTGPPMRGKGSAQVRLWKSALGNKDEQMLRKKDLRTLLDLPYGAKSDHPEGMTVVGRQGRRAAVLIVYDSAGRRRMVAPAGTRASLHTVLL